MIKYSEYSTFYFDLDRTVWNTVDKYNNPIWARQMIQPYVKIDDDTIMDDCLSVCKLEPHIREYLTDLNNNKKKINYISRGGLLHVRNNQQPANILLHMFSLSFIFNERLLLHKLDIKHRFITHRTSDVIFFDDSIEEIELMQTNCPKIKCIHKTADLKWKDLM